MDKQMDGWTDIWIYWRMGTRGGIINADGQIIMTPSLLNVDDGNLLRQNDDKYRHQIVIFI